MAGDGAAAAQQCPAYSDGAINYVVNSCFAHHAAACNYWRQRCATFDRFNCDACLADIVQAGQDALAIGAALLTESCQYAGSVPLNGMANSCPDMSTCQVAVINCVNAYGYICLNCLNGSATPSQAATCVDLAHEYAYDARCQSCSGSVTTINFVVFATAVVGGVSALVCLAVTTTIVAHSRDRVSMRDRIVVGLMMANAVYSTANAIPLNLLRTDTINCGRVALSFDTIRIGRALWFCGKYGLVSFELFILGASIRALKRGLSVVPPRSEAAMHAACCTVAVVAFLVFYAQCLRINADGYNNNTENEVYTNAFSHGNLDDDLDDQEPSVAASSAFQTARASYDNLVRELLVAWDALVRTKPHHHFAFANSDVICKHCKDFAAYALSSCSSTDATHVAKKTHVANKSDTCERFVPCVTVVLFQLHLHACTQCSLLPFVFTNTHDPR